MRREDAHRGMQSAWMVVTRDCRLRIMVGRRIFHPNPEIRGPGIVLSIVTMKALAESEQRDAAAEALFERRMALVMEAVDLHHTHLVDYLWRLTRQRQDAEDLTQNLWRYVLLHFPEGKITCLSLLRRKAYQLFVDHYRAAVRRREVLTDEVPDIPLTAPREAAYSETAEKELQGRFWSEFEGIELSAQQKEVLWLHARYGFTYQEIEARLGIASSTVGDWVHLGRQRLAAYLDVQQTPQQNRRIS